MAFEFSSPRQEVVFSLSSSSPLFNSLPRTGASALTFPPALPKPPPPRPASLRQRQIKPSFLPVSTGSLWGGLWGGVGDRESAREPWRRGMRCKPGRIDVHGALTQPRHGLDSRCSALRPWSYIIFSPVQSSFYREKKIK